MPHQEPVFPGQNRADTRPNSDCDSMHKTWSCSSQTQSQHEGELDMKPHPWLRSCWPLIAADRESLSIMVQLLVVSPTQDSRPHAQES